MGWRGLGDLWVLVLGRFGGPAWAVSKLCPLVCYKSACLLVPLHNNWKLETGNLTSAAGSGTFDYLLIFVHFSYLHLLIKLINLTNASSVSFIKFQSKILSWLFGVWVTS